MDTGMNTCPCHPIKKFPCSFADAIGKTLTRFQLKAVPSAKADPTEFERFRAASLRFKDANLANLQSMRRIWQEEIIAPRTR